MFYPLISIIIATRNSEKTILRTLKSIKKQNYSKKKIEILVVDGRSEDRTREIAKKFGCKIIDNPKLEFVNAKYLGFFNAKGKFALYLDSDEELINRDSIKIKVSSFYLSKGVRAVSSSGYITPKNSSSINHYINELGDPFSFFIYRSTINSKFLLGNLKDKYKIFLKNKKVVIFDFSFAKKLPLLEFVEMGGMLDIEYIKKEVPEFKVEPNLLAHFLYIFVKKHGLIAVSVNDPINHYSSATLNTYLNKIAWRVKNNIYKKDTLAFAGFEGREQFQSASYRLKRYFFIPYSFSIIFPLLDSIYLSVTRGDIIFFIHPILCIYTSILILYHYSRKLLNVRPNLKTYGN